MKFTEERIEQAILDLLAAQDYPHAHGETLALESPQCVLIKSDLRTHLKRRNTQPPTTQSRPTTLD